MEAKSYSYDGEDWGDDDGYDEYGESAEYPAAQKPTGLRQQGQSVSRLGATAPQIHHNPKSGLADSSWRPTANAGSLIPQSQRPFYDSASVQSTSPNAVSLRNRSDSFAKGDDQSTNIGTVIATGGPQIQQSSKTQQFYQQPTQSASRPSIDGPSRPNFQNIPSTNHHGLGYPGAPRQSSNESRSQSMTSISSIPDFHGRRNYATPALSQPPHPATRAHPPRKSSLNQDDDSHLGRAEFQSPSAIAAQTHDLGGEDSVDSSSKLVPEPPSFVRPADIYKRMYEEKAKERQSQESARLSIDKTMITNEEGSAQIREGQIDDSTTLKQTDQPDIGGDAAEEHRHRLKQSLNPVAERQSEYGMEGIKLSPSLTTTEKTVESSPKNPPAQSAAERGGRPILPDVTRMSGFGESLLGSLNEKLISHQSSANDASSEIITPQAGEQTLSQEEKFAALRHQNSLGFRSVVNKAFNDQIPPTPSSTAGSAIARSNSESTNEISPILSRAASNIINPDGNINRTDTRDRSIQPIAEASEESVAGIRSRPTSLDTLTTPKDAGSGNILMSHTKAESSASNFIPVVSSHRQNNASPSPGDSPAYTPATGTTSQIRSPQEAELAVTKADNTPSISSTSLAISTSTQNHHEPDHRSIFGRPPLVVAVPTATAPLISAPVSAQFKAGPVSQSQPVYHFESSHTPGTSAPNHTHSPSKGRVRDLAEKFESPVGSRQSSELSLRELTPGTQPPNTDEVSILRPSVDHLDSFRPQLPGGWNSFASNAEFPASSVINTPPEQQPRLIGPDYQPCDSSELDGMPINSVSKTGTEAYDVERNPFLGVSREVADDTSIPVTNSLESPTTFHLASGHSLAPAPAGPAVGVSVVAAAHAMQKDLVNEYISIERSNEDNASASVKSHSLHSEASGQLARHEDHSTSSVPPTPISKDSPDSLDRPRSSDYFAPVVPLKQKPRGLSIGFDTTPFHPRMLPALSTETSPHDYESDRLRKEIVRELSPAVDTSAAKISAEVTAHQSGAGTTDRRDTRQSLHQSTEDQEHDSAIIPTEYDSYWNESASENDANGQISGHTKSSSIPPLDPIEHPDYGDPSSVERRRLTERVPIVPVVSSGLASILSELPPRSADVNKEQISSDLQVRPSILTHRFSWEPEPEPAGTLQKLPSSHNQISSTTPTLFGSNMLDNTTAYPTGPDERTIDAGVSDVLKRLQQEPSAASNQASQPSNTSPCDLVANTSAQADHFPSRPAIKIDIPPIPTDQPKVPTFREIQASKDPSERIQGFNSARELVASADTGLDHWIATTINNNPEHADLLSNGAHLVAPGRQKLVINKNGPRSSGVSSQSTQQQPYYQQYLDASSKLGQPSPTNAKSSLTPAHSPTPSNPAGRVSGQHVQLKGKELLHSAGVFGGKANHAARGLFSKGKSKFRGSGGGDKVDI